MLTQHKHVTRIPHIIAVILGLYFARSERSYRIVARSVAIMLCIRVARDVCRSLRPNAAERIAAYVSGHTIPPYVGIERASWAAEQALTIGWYIALGWTAWETLRVPERGPSHVDDDGRNRFCSTVVACLSTFIFVSVELYLIYPSIRGRIFEAIMVCVFFASLAAQSFSFASHAMGRRRPNAARLVALLIVVGSVADALGQWASGQPVRDAEAAGPAGVLVWVLIGGIELWAIAAARSGRSSRYW